MHISIDKSYYYRSISLIEVNNQVYLNSYCIYYMTMVKNSIKYRNKSQYLLVDKLKYCKTSTRYRRKD